MKDQERREEAAIAPIGKKLPNRSFDTDTQRHCAAKRASEPTPLGAMPLRAGQLRRWTSEAQ